MICIFYPQKSLFSPLPEPNGYDIFVQAAAKISRGDKTLSLKELTTNELAELVAVNKAALIELRRGLKLASAVPVWMDESWIRTQTTNMVNLKRAAYAMDAESFFLYQQGDVVGALNNCLDLMRFGQAISRRGVLINFLIGSACEVIAARRMTNLITNCNAAECKRAVLALQEHEALRESFDDIMGREKEWSRRTYGITAQVRLMIQERSLQPGEWLQPVVRTLTNEYYPRCREVRSVLLRLAARAFELERGRKPQLASELIPDFLRAEPVDPSTNKPLELP